MIDFEQSTNVQIKQRQHQSVLEVQILLLQANPRLYWHGTLTVAWCDVLRLLEE